MGKIINLREKSKQGIKSKYGMGYRS